MISIALETYTFGVRLNLADHLAQELAFLLSFQAKSYTSIFSPFAELCKGFVGEAKIFQARQQRSQRVVGKGISENVFILIFMGNISGILRSSVVFENGFNAIQSRIHTGAKLSFVEIIHG